MNPNSVNIWYDDLMICNKFIFQSMIILDEEIDLFNNFSYDQSEFRKHSSYRNKKLQVIRSHLSESSSQCPLA
jgi:hypothetical protein